MEEFLKRINDCEKLCKINNTDFMHFQKQYNELQQRHNEDKISMIALIEKIREQIETLKQENNVLKDTIKIQQNEIQALGHQIVDQRRDQCNTIKEVKQGIKQCTLECKLLSINEKKYRGEISAMQIAKYESTLKLEIFEERVTSIENLNPLHGTFCWIVNNYKKAAEEKEILYSPKFRCSLAGQIYRLCLRWSEHCLNKVTVTLVSTFEVVNPIVIFPFRKVVVSCIKRGSESIKSKVLTYHDIFVDKTEGLEIDCDFVNHLNPLTIFCNFLPNNEINVNNDWVSFI